MFWKSYKVDNTVHVMEKKAVLDMAQYQHWFQAIRADDHTAVQHILNEADQKERERLLGCPFAYEESVVEDGGCEEGQCYQVHMPLAVAACAGAMQVARVLLRAGLDPAQQDQDGNTVMHKLILTIFYHPEQEAVVLRSFHTLLALLMLSAQEEEDAVAGKQLAATAAAAAVFERENKFGLRPLEFAVQHGVLAMFLAIMEIPGVYRYKQHTQGLLTYTYYDVTDYEGEGGSRRHVSPLWLLTFMDRAAMGSKSHYALNEKKYMQQWFRNNFLNNLPFVLILFFWRLFYVTCYFVADVDTSFYEDYVPGNSTDHCRPEDGIVLQPAARLAINIYLIVHSLTLVVADITQEIRSRGRREWPIWNTVRGKKDYVAQFAIYKWCDFIFAVFVIVRFMLTLPGYLSEDLRYWVDLFRMICPVLSTWSMLFFMQLLPSIGHFVIGVQKIILDMGHFVLIYVIMFMPFVVAFQTLINTKTNVGCIDGFATFFEAMYSVFSVMLNMLDLKGLDIRNNEILLFGHVIFTFIISIMMINFFIAILSNTVSFMEQHSLSSITRQRCAVSYLIHSQQQWLCRRACNRRPLRHFVQLDGRVLLVDVAYSTCKEEGDA